MATPQLSPGVLVREVDLTVGRQDNVLLNVGAIAAPFSRGPVEEVVDISNEQELLNTFGRPKAENLHYEYWMSAASYLSYGGTAKVVRVDGSNLKNAAVGFAVTTQSVKIKNYDDYLSNYDGDSVNWAFAAKNPGEHGNSLQVCVIDDGGDQILRIDETKFANVSVATTSLVGYGITATLTNVPIVGNGTTSNFNGYLKGIITGIVTTSNADSRSELEVKIVSRVDTTGTETFVDYAEGDSAASIDAADKVYLYDDTGSLISPENALTGITTVGFSTILSEANQTYSGVTGTATDGTGATFNVFRNNVGGISTVTIAGGGRYYADGETITISHVSIGGTVTGDDLTLTASSVEETITVNTTADWYGEQTLGLTGSTVYWKSLAPKPGTTTFANERSGLNDEIHVAVVDAKGDVSGIQNEILETHLGLSKATDATSAVNAPTSIYWKDYLADNSAYIFSGANLSTGVDGINGTEPLAIRFDTTQANGFVPRTTAQGLWDTNAQSSIYSSIGRVTYTLVGGQDYQASGGMTASLGDLNTGYDLLNNTEEHKVDFLIMGPGLATQLESQAKANKLISIANARKDCVAVISPHRGNVVDVTNSDTQVSNVTKFFAPLSSSSYAVFDSGYKYTFDRFNNKFVYIPCNADVAGLMARTEVTAFPWFSPAGEQRGILNNAVKLALSPTKEQRDTLYEARVNPIVNQSGVGVMLFGDKTALSYASAFDRINVRRLFLVVEASLRGTANATLFEFNDAVTRANFVNVVEPYLRDVQAKRGLFDFRVICDETNNTPSVIDNNEFRADIFLKPARSINYVTLTFVATRTGVDFQEVVGRV